MPNDSTIRATIETVIRQVADESGKDLAADFGEETVLLESGLDSLDFAIVVARLEQELEFDPFSADSNPWYPRTYADLVRAYESLGR
ncbi:MAG: acyl carrier protein [Planctomycetota bacterium]